MKFRFGLDLKIGLVFLLVALLPFLVVSFLISTSVQKYTRHITKKSMTLLTLQVGREVERFLSDTLMYTKALAEDPVIRSSSSAPNTVEREIRKIADFCGLFEDISLIDKEGQLVASTSPEYRDGWKNKKWFADALQGKISVSPVHPVLMPFRLVYVTAAPVRGEDGRVRAVLTGQVSLDQVRRLTGSRKSGKTGFVFIVDQNGVLVDFPDKNLQLQKIEPERLRRQILAGDEGFVDFADRDGVEKICVFGKLDGFGFDGNMSWYVGMVQDRAEAFDIERQITTQILLLALGGAFIMLLLSALLSRTIVLPIRKMVDATERIADGDLNSHVRFDSDDEIGDLANAFNAMVRKLRFSRGEILAEKEWLDVTLRSIADAVITIDKEGKIALLSEVAERLSGWKQAEIQGRLFDETFFFADKDSYAEAVSLGMVNQDFYQRGRRRELTVADGRVLTVLFSATPIKDKSGELIGTVVILQDITAEERVREELNKLQKLETIGVLAGGIAHDFNNVLTSIVGNVALAKFELDPNCEAFGLLTDVEKTTMEAKQLTQQLLAFSRGGSPVKKVTAIGPLIKEAVDFVSRGSNVVCEYRIPDELWTADVDPGQIRQVLNNLTINAIQAMQKGGRITVAAHNVLVNRELRLPLPEGMYIKICFEDEGAGIDKENLPKIFDPFFTTKSSGSGLGLAGVYSILKKHGGYISVDSEPGKGTTFFIYLPAVNKEAEGQKDEPCGLIQGQGRVLVMDDEDPVRKMLGQYLSKLGFDVVLTSHGEEAVEKYSEAFASGAPFSLVILDLTVRGGMGGKDAILELKKLDPKVKAIVSSGYSMDPIMANYRDFGFSAMLSKPFSNDDLIRTLNEVFKAR